jgi:hypothetical protein
VGCHASRSIGVEETMICLIASRAAVKGLQKEEFHFLIGWLVESGQNDSQKAVFPLNELNTGVNRLCDDC